MKRKGQVDFIDRYGAVLDDTRTFALHFGDERAEYDAAHETTALADLSSRGRIEIAGNDGLRLLQNLCTAELAKLAVGAGTEAFFPDSRGRILAYPKIFLHPESIWLDVEPGRAETVIAHLDRFVIREDVQLTNRTADFAQLHVTGPQSSSTLAAAMGAEVPPLENLQHMSRTIGGQSCQVRRVDRSVRPGYDILVDVDHAEAVWEALTSAGGEFGIRPLGQNALEVLRIEAGLPVYGKDVSEENLPQEIGRDAQAISFTKGCYLGQETVARIDSYGHVNKTLCGLVLAGDQTVAAGSTVRREEKEIGRLTSAAFSPRISHGVALAFLRTSHRDPGTAVTIDSESGNVPATVSALPFRVDE